MKKRNLAFFCRLLCLVLAASFILETPLRAFVETIPVKVGNQMLNVTPGQWIAVRSGTQVTHYNVRYVNGQPVALELSQYTKLIFGSTGGNSANTAGTANSPAGNPSANSGNSPANSGYSNSNSGNNSANSGYSSGNSSANSGYSNSTSGNSSANSGYSNSTSGNSSANSGYSNSTSGNQAGSSGGFTRDPKSGLYLPDAPDGFVRDTKSGLYVPDAPDGYVRDSKSGLYLPEGTTSNSNANSNTNSSANSSTNPSNNSGGYTGDTSVSNTTGSTVTRWRDPITGRFVKAGTPGAVQVGVRAGGTSSGQNTPVAGGGSQTSGSGPLVSDDGIPLPGTSGQSSQAYPGDYDGAPLPRNNGQSGQGYPGDYDGAPLPRNNGQSGQSYPGDYDGAPLPRNNGQSSQGYPGDYDGAPLPGNSGQSGQGYPTDPDGAPLPGNSGQSGQGYPTDPDGAPLPGNSGQSGQGNQGDPDGMGAPAKPGLKEVTGNRFRSGYEAGKAMTNQGFQNVKDSLKSGFTPKNILMTAGITVGVDLATQVMRGEKPSVKKALKTVCSAEFAGGVVGSVTGAAAGSFFVPFLTAIPVVGGVMSALAPTFGSIVGGSVGAYLAGDLKNGRFSIREAFKKIDWIGVAGQTIGSTAGVALGSFLGPVGAIIGGIIGGYLGNWAAHKIAQLFGKDNGAGGSYSSIAMPVGTNPLGQANNGPVTIGDGATLAIPGSNVTVSDAPPVSAVVETPSGANQGSMTLKEAEAAYRAAYARYTQIATTGETGDIQNALKDYRESYNRYMELRAASGQK